MLGSMDTRRGKLSAVVRVRSQAVPVTSTRPSEDQPRLCVWPDGPHSVAVEVPECHAAQARRESFEVSRALPLDATPEEVFEGVGGPVVAWLLDGFNALVLSYGQACTGKSTLLVGSGREVLTPSAGKSRAASTPSAVPTPDPNRPFSDIQAEHSKRGSEDIGFTDNRRAATGGPDGARGGLLNDILRAIFDNAVTAAAGAGNGEDNDVLYNDNDGVSAAAAEMERNAASTGFPLRRANGCLCGSEAEFRCAVDPLLENAGREPRGAAVETEAAAAVVGNVRGVVSEGCVSEEDRCAGPGDTTGMASLPSGVDEVHPRRRRPTVVALSAWEMAGNAVRDLLLPPPGRAGSTRDVFYQPVNDNGLAGKVDTADINKKSCSGGSNDSSRNNGSNSSSNRYSNGYNYSNGDSNSNSNINIDSNSNSYGDSNSNGYSNSNSNGYSNSRSISNEAGGEGRGRGSHVNSARGEDLREVPEGTSGNAGRGRNRGRSRGRNKGRSGSSDDSSGWPSGYPNGFRTVEAPNVTTALKLVETALRRSADNRQGEVGPSVEASGETKDGQVEAGRRGGEGKAGSGSPGHVFFRVVVYNGSEETVSTLHLVDLEGGWEPSDDKPAGKASGKPAGKRGTKASPWTSARPSAASRAWNSFDAMVVGLAAAARSSSTGGSLFPRSSGGGGGGDGGGDSRAAGDNTSSGGGCKCGGACSGEASLPGPSNGNAGDGDGEAGRKKSEPTIAVEGSNTAAAVPAPPSPPPPPPHPMYGCPKGKSFGGGGGGRLVEALRPLISGNARTWMVVSVGEGGKGGPGAAWRALDVARRATDIATTCIRLRGVTLADLRLRNACDVLAGEKCCPRCSSCGVAAAGNAGTKDRVAREGSLSSSESGVIVNAAPQAATGGVQGPTALFENDRGIGTGQKGILFLPSPTPPRLKGASGAYGGPENGANGRDCARETTPTARSPSDRSSGNSLTGAAVGGPLIVSPPAGGVGGVGGVGDRGGGGGVGGGVDDGVGRITTATPSGVLDGGHYESLRTALGGGAGEGTKCVDAFLEGFHRGGAVQPRGSSSGSAASDDRVQQVDSACRIGQDDIGSDHIGTQRRRGGPSDSNAAPGDPTSAAAAAALKDLNLLLGEQVPPHRAPSPRPTETRASTAVRTSSMLRPRGSSEASNVSAEQRSLAGAGADRAKEGAEPQGGGDAVASTAVARARANIDRMMSSLLEDVLPESSKKKSAVASEKGGRGEKEAAVSPRRCLAEARKAPPTTGDDTMARTCPPTPTPQPPPPLPSRFRPPSPPTLPPANTTSTPPRREPGSEGGGDHGVFLTPIEVLMHTSAGSERGMEDARCTKQTENPGRRPAKEGGRSAGSTAVVAGHPAVAGRAGDEEEAVAASGLNAAPGGGGIRDAGGSDSLARAPKAPHESRARRRRRGSTSGIDRRTPPSPAAKGGREMPTTPNVGSPLLPLSAAKTAANHADDNEKTTRRSGGDEEAAGAPSRNTTSAVVRSEGTVPGARPRPTEWKGNRSGKTAAKSESLRDAARGEGGGEGEGKVDALEHRNHAALLRVILEQEKRIKQMERRFEAKECDWLERVTALEAEREGLRAEAVEARGRLRRAESSSPSAEVFETYEAHASLLEAENACLRDQNISLELRLLDVLRHSAAVAESNGSSAASPSAANPRAAAATTGKPTTASSRAVLERRRAHEGGGRSSPDVGGGGGYISRSSAAAASKFRVDGRVVSTAAVNGSAVPGVPVLTAALRDLRRRLREAELEVKGMRAERVSVEKRDRRSQALLRTLSEQRSNVRELVLQERHREAELTASRLESARAEALAERSAAEIDGLRDSKASLWADREALLHDLAEERSKSRRFDEDRRAYGHIRRFIERHAGGRPAEWDASADQEIGSSHGFRGSAAGPADRARHVAENMRRGRAGAAEEDVGLTNGHRHSGRKGGRSSVSCRPGPDASARRVPAYPLANPDIEVENGGYIDSYCDYYKCGAGGRANRGIGVGGGGGGHGDGGDTVGGVSGGTGSGNGPIGYVGGRFERGGRREKTGGGVTPCEWNDHENEHCGDSYAETAPATETPTRGYEVDTSDGRTTFAKESFASTTGTRREEGVGGRGEAGVARDWRRTTGGAFNRDVDRGWYA